MKKYDDNIRVGIYSFYDMDAKGENKGAGGDIPLAADLIDDYAEISKQMQVRMRYL